MPGLRQKLDTLVPFWGRLELRLTMALVALSTLCVGASSYLVYLTSQYFESIVSEQIIAGNEAAEHARPFYGRFVEAKREAFNARVETIAVRLQHSNGSEELDVLEESLGRDAEIARIEIRDEGQRLRRIDSSRAELLLSVENGNAVPVSQMIDSHRELRVWFARDLISDLEYQTFGASLRRLGTVELDGVRVDRKQVESGLWLAMLAANGLVLTVAVTIGLILARSMTRKASEIARVMNQVTQGNLDARVLRIGDDELGRLAQSLNQMLDELDEARQTLAYLQRIEVWQEMARRLAHEIKNPLTPIQLAVQQLREKDNGQDPQFSAMLRESVEIIEDEVDGMRRLVTNFSQFSRLPDAQLAPIELAAIVRDFVRVYGSISEHDEDRLVVEDAGEKFPILGDRQLLKHSLVNLVENAVLSAQESQIKPIRVEIGLARNIDSHGEWVELSVSDNGPGVDASKRESIFEPYETSRSEGSGLGLAIVKKIVLDHGGRMGVSESSLGGARFSLFLPINHQSTEPGST